MVVTNLGFQSPTAVCSILNTYHKKMIPAAKHLQIICPHHCQHELEAINHNTLICSQCDPRLANIEGGM